MTSSPKAKELGLESPCHKSLLKKVVCFTRLFNCLQNCYKTVKALQYVSMVHMSFLTKTVARKYDPLGKIVFRHLQAELMLFILLIFLISNKNEKSQELTQKS